MSRRVTILVLMALLCLSVIHRPQKTKSAFGLQNPTIPTRTPTPAPTSPPPPPPPTVDNGVDDTPPPPATEIPQATATTVVVTMAATPIGGFLPTAAPCSDRPTIQAANPANVRRGPGTNYEIVATLVFLEVRYIIGRAGNAPWWLIQLDNNQQGWIADEVVRVQGYTGIVPIAPPPSLNGQATPGASWNPTPPPFCTVTPTATRPTETPTTTTTAEASVEEAGAAVSTVIDEVTTPTVTAASPTATFTATPTATSVSQTIAEVSETGVAPSPPMTTPLNVEPPATTPDFLPIAALLLLAAGVLMMFVRRRRREGSESTPHS